MPVSRIVRRKVEIYATTLFEFASGAKTEAQALAALLALEQSTPEVRSSVLVLAELGKGALLGEITAAYGCVVSGETPKEASDAVTVAQTLYAAARNEHHSARVLSDLHSLAIMTPEVWQLLAVIGTGSDRRLIPSIVAKYRAIVEERGSTIPVEVTSAVPLDAQLRSSIVKKVSAKLGRSVYLMEHVDPAIIGGLVLTVGDERHDASVRAQLESMREVLTASGPVGMRPVRSNASVGGDGE